ncbi:MFS transporter [Streptomyces sp. TRM43335]|uniref:MFS transporter n=1 Tax=Streptomyces taklimakanensis TaxID=2569853 RepID=A0A6G2B830_9ACTN|nr:MFS transporter [Streptomyces taklimakanensis]MTE18435.1 MFS transporter [Streptomyces taklimakanensis]
MADDPVTTSRRTSGDTPNSVGAAPAENADAAAPRWARWLPVAGLVLVAFNLRPAITGLGPLLAEVRTALGMNGTVAGLLTSAPALCFAVFGSVAPRLARSRGPSAVVLAGTAAVTAGLALRPLAGGTGGFLAASALALAGIAACNVLLPVIVKQRFPDRTGPMTGLYSMALSLGTATAAALTVPVTETLGGDWRLGLGMWALPGALALSVWLPITREARRRAARPTTAPGPGGPGGSEGGRSDADGGAASGVRITRSATAWALGIFFGFQATAAYITMGWLPQIFRDAGVPAATAGLLLAVTMGLGIPLSFVLPRIAARLGHQGPLAATLALCGLGGYAGLWFAPAQGAWAWALLLGVSNCAFPLVLTLIGMRARTGAGVARLSAFAQGTGYLISIPGPLLVGSLHQHTGGWHAPLALMAALMVAQLAAGLLAGRDRYVEDGD